MPNDRMEPNELWTTTLECVPAGIAVLDRNMRYLHVSSRWIKDYNLDGKNILGRSHYDLFPEISDEWKEIHRQCLKGAHRGKEEDSFLRSDGSLQWIRWDIRPWHESDGAIGGITIYSEDITRRKVAELRLRDTLFESVSALASLIEIRDPFTHGHQSRVAELSVAIGLKMGLPEEQIDALHLAATVHDIGKMYVPIEILAKPGRLTPLEMDMIREHVVAGYRVLKNISFQQPIAEIVYQHHERLDGSGYPCALRDNEIHIEAKILAIADTVDAMISHRPYRPAKGLDAALREIREGSGKLYDFAASDAVQQLFSHDDFTFSNRAVLGADVDQLKD